MTSADLKLSRSNSTPSRPTALKLYSRKTSVSESDSFAAIPGSCIDTEYTLSDLSLSTNPQLSEQNVKSTLTSTELLHIDAAGSSIPPLLLDLMNRWYVGKDFYQKLKDLITMDVDSNMEAITELFKDILTDCATEGKTDEQASIALMAARYLKALEARVQKNARNLKQTINSMQGNDDHEER